MRATAVAIGALALCCVLVELGLVAVVFGAAASSWGVLVAVPLVAALVVALIARRRTRAECG